MKKYLWTAPHTEQLANLGVFPIELDITASFNFKSVINVLKNLKVQIK